MDAVRARGVDRAMGQGRVVVAVVAEVCSEAQAVPVAADVVVDRAVVVLEAAVRAVGQAVVGLAVRMGVALIWGQQGEAEVAGRGVDQLASRIRFRSLGRKKARMKPRWLQTVESPTESDSTSHTVPVSSRTFTYLTNPDVHTIIFVFRRGSSGRR